MDKEELKQIYASIHTLRMEGDRMTNGRDRLRIIISIHTSAWRVTLHEVERRYLTGISIHTLRVEGDGTSSQCRRPKENFNPHPPHPPRGG